MYSLPFLDPSNGRSKTFAADSGASGLMLFFLTDSGGNSFMGIQIGHAANQVSGYASIDVILSGATVNQLTPSWVIQDSMQNPTPNAWSGQLV